MSRRALFALVLAGLLAAPPPILGSSLATLSGVASSAGGRPLVGVDLDLVNLDTGQVTTVRTDGSGTFKARVDPGLYALAARGGYAVVRGPRSAHLVAGQALSADLALASLREDSSAGSDDEENKKKRRRGAAVFLGVTLVGLATAAAILAVHSPSR